MNNELDIPDENFRLISSDGVVFDFPVKFLAESSWLFESFFDSRNAGYLEHKERVYTWQNIDGQTFHLIIQYLQGERPVIPDEYLVPVLDAVDFLMLDHHTALQEFCYAVVTRVPFAFLEDESFHSKILTRSPLVSKILARELVISDQERLEKLFKSWHFDDEGLVSNVVSALELLAAEEREVAVFFEDCDKNCIAFDGNYSFQWLHTIQFELPDGCQHLAFRGECLVYSTAHAVGSSAHEDYLYARDSLDERLSWPLLLQRYGRRIFWTEGNCQTIRVWKASEELNFDPQQAQTIKVFESKGMIVRHIATTDSKYYGHLTVLVIHREKKKLLYFKNIGISEDFVNLRCPMNRIDCVAILNDVIYVIGNRTTSSYSDRMICYRDGRWSEPIYRLKKNIPKAFFPLNGRLYVISSNCDTCEVYEVALKRWVLIDFPKLSNSSAFGITSSSMIRGEIGKL